MTHSNTIHVEALVREYKNGPRAVDGIDLEVGSGEIYGFLGPNGAGKSTTVKMLVTLLPPSGGRAVVGGYDIAREGPDVRRVIGVALQDASVDPLLTAREHVRLQAGLHGFTKEEALERGELLLERVGLSGAGDRKVRTYSGGMRRRLDLALSLVHRPMIVFLDEPTTGLDPQSRTALWDEVRRLAKDEGVTVFLTTQYLEEADVLADRVGIIERGRMVAEGTPAALKAEIGRQTVEIMPENAEDRPRIESILSRFGELTGSPGAAISIRLGDRSVKLAEIVRSLDGAGVAIADLELHAPTLDDVFLEKTGRKLEGAGASEEGVEEEAVPAGPEPELGLREAVAARSRIERVPTALLKEWMVERRVQHVEEAPGGAAWSLAARDGPLAGRAISIGSRVLIGRNAADLVVPDPEISRRHAIVKVVEGMPVIEDLQSLNGTWVNGQRIVSPTLLAPGDRITIGKSTFEVQPDARGGTPR